MFGEPYPPVNKHSNGKSPSWIGKTSSNGGKTYLNGWFGGTTIFGNTHIDHSLSVWEPKNLFCVCRILWHVCQMALGRPWNTIVVYWGFCDQPAQVLTMSGVHGENPWGDESLDTARNDVLYGSASKHGEHGLEFLSIDEDGNQRIHFESIILHHVYWW